MTSKALRGRKINKKHKITKEIRLKMKDERSDEENLMRDKFIRGKWLNAQRWSKFIQNPKLLKYSVAYSSI